MKKEAITKALALVNRKDMMSTLGLIDENGYPFVSAVLCFKHDGLKEFWISSSLGARKTKLITNCDKASICYHDINTNVTMTGRAEIITDSATKKKLWEDWMADYYTGGAESQEYCLIKISVQRLRIYADGKNFDMDIDET